MEANRGQATSQKPIEAKLQANTSYIGIHDIEHCVRRLNEKVQDFLGCVTCVVYAKASLTVSSWLVKLGSA